MDAPEKADTRPQIFKLSEAMRAYAEATRLRLSYLYPSLQFDLRENALEVSGHFPAGVDALRREITYSLYRERIFSETLPLRRSLIEMVSRK